MHNKREEKNLKVIAVIPARYHSSRFEGKVLAEIHGKPLVEWVYRQTVRSLLVNKTIVATDDERIFKAVTKFGGEAIMTSANLKTGTDRIAEAVKDIEADLVVNVQGDEPLITPEVIDSVIKPLLEIPDLEMATAASEIKNKNELTNPNVVKVTMDRDNYALYFSRSRIPYQCEEQEFSPVYKHLGIYSFRKDFLLRFISLPPCDLEKAERLEQLRAIGNGYKIKVIKTKYAGIGVDTKEDLEKVIQITSNLQMD